MAEQQTETPVQDQTQVVETPAVEETTLLGAEQKTETTETEVESTEKQTTPEKYELKAPEGMELDSALLDKFTPIFKEIGLTQEQAQKLADTYASEIKAKSEAQSQQSIKAYQEIVEGWKSETLKELGADSAKTLAAASKAIDSLGSPQLREVLNETGLGNNIELVKFFVNVGKKLSQDSLVEPNKQSVVGFSSIYDHPTSKETLK